MKYKCPHIRLFVLILMLILTGCTPQKYIDEAKTIFTDNDLDCDASMVFDSKYEGYDVYKLVVTSEKYSEISDLQKIQLLKKLDSIYVEGGKLLVLTEVISQGYTFSLDYEGDLKRDGETYPPPPTPIPFEMPSGDFEMSWNIYDKEYNTLGGILTIRRQGSKYTQELVMSDGSSETTVLSVLSDGDEIRLTDRPGNPFGDYMYISSTGYLYFCDNQGVIYTVPPLN